MPMVIDDAAKRRGAAGLSVFLSLSVRYRPAWVEA
jgi:hypothetical protein